MPLAHGALKRLVRNAVAHTELGNPAHWIEKERMGLKLGSLRKGHVAQNVNKLCISFQ